MVTVLMCSYPDLIWSGVDVLDYYASLREMGSSNLIWREDGSMAKIN